LIKNDYNPFGMVQPDRKFTATTGYRYGLSGKEKDNEVKGEGNQIDYGARIHDPRVGKWLSVDPLFREYSHISPYAYMSNDPINRIDPTGMGDYYGKDGKKLGSDGKTVTVGSGKSAKQVSDDKAYTTSQAVINQYTKNGVTDWDQVIANSGTSQLSVGNSTLNKFANTVAGESSGDKTESYALASAIVNLSKHKSKDILKTISTEGIYGYKDGGNNPNYKNNAEFSMEAVINALTGGVDYSYGAIRWDGFDLAGKGFDHIKPRTEGVEISYAHFSTFTKAWSHGTELKAYSSGKFTKVSSNFSSGIHLATAGDHKGRCLLISTAAHGKTIFWGINRDPVLLITDSPPGNAPYEFMLNWVPTVIDQIHVNKGFKGWSGL
jgi:RHS repeat-associated protein